MTPPPPSLPYSSYYVLKSEDYYRNFKQSIKSKDTFVTYDHRLKAFMKYRGLGEGQYSQLIEGKDIKVIEAEIIDFIIFLKERNYSLGSQKAYLNALNHFYSINDLMIRRNKISKFLSNDDDVIIAREGESDSDSSSSSNGNKPYTHEQIAKLLEYSDIRTRVIILLMCSSGMRLGAVHLLKVGDLIPVPDHNIYQIRVYANSRSSRYYTFWTPECKKAIDNYLEYRRSCGENITPKSPLLRREFDKHDIFQVANDVRPLTRPSIKKALGEVLYASGLRTPLVIQQEDKRRLNNRRQTPMSHGFRKFFDTTCTNSGMNPIYIEFCLGHSLRGVKDSYFLPQPDSNGVYLDILEGHDNKSIGYIDAIDSLTINEENRLKRRIKQLTIKTDKLDLLQEQIEALNKKLGLE
jgi:integrase